MELALIYNFQSLSSFFPFQSSFFSRVSFFVIFTIAKELTSISLASSVASDVHFHCRIQFSSLSHLKDRSPRNRFVDMMFFCPWHLTDVAPPLIRIPFPNFAICLLYRDSLLECTLVLSRRYHYLNWRTKLLRIVSQKSQSLFRGLPCTVFPVPKNNYYTRAALFSAPEFSSGKYPWKHGSSYSFCHLCYWSPTRPLMKKSDHFHATRIPPHNRKTRDFERTYKQLTRDNLSFHRQQSRRIEWWYHCFSENFLMFLLYNWMSLHRNRWILSIPFASSYSLKSSHSEIE